MPLKSHKTFFMPMFCKSSINDAINPPKPHNPSPTDPSSPKLSCIGQLKKKPTTTATITGKPTLHSNRYIKLNKLFSGKNLISPAIDTGSINISTGKFNSVTTRSKSYNGRGRTGRTPISRKKCYVSKDDQDVVRVVAGDQELDPPLPVKKCGRRDQESNENLWKRRGFEMKSLQIQPIQLSVNRIGGNNDGGFAISTSATTFR